LIYWLHWLQFKDNNPYSEKILAVERLRKLPVDCCNFMAFAATFANTIAWGVKGIHSRDTNYMSRTKSFFLFISFNLRRILANINTHISDNYLSRSLTIFCRVDQDFSRNGIIKVRRFLSVKFANISYSYWNNVFKFKIKILLLKILKI